MIRVCLPTRNKPLLYSLVLILSCILFSTGCRSNQSTLPSAPTIQSIVSDRLGDDFESYPNSTGEYILCVQPIPPDNTLSSIRFLVIQKTDSKILLTQSFLPGYVKWFTETSLEVLSTPGILKEHESLSDYIKIIDIRTSEN